MSGAFDSWFNASKYTQVVYSPDSRQPALDGWQASERRILAILRAVSPNAGEDCKLLIEELIAAIEDNSLERLRSKESHEIVAKHRDDADL